MKKTDKTQILLENKELFQASLEEFATKSYNEASTNEILKKSNYNKGSFYYRFENKDDLYIALINYLIVKQIDLFNNRDFSLSKKQDVEDILFELFFNLYDLYNENPHYYKALINGLNNPDSSRIIKDNCIEPLYQRVFTRLLDFELFITHKELSIIIENLYFHFPKTLLDHLTTDESIGSLIKFILNKTSDSSIKETKKPIDINTLEPKDNPTYLLANSDKKIVYPDIWSNLMNDFFEVNRIKKEVKKILSLSFFNYSKVIKKAIQRSFKNMDHLFGFINDDILLSIRQDRNFKYFLIVCLYHCLKETKIIVIDFRYDIFNYQKLLLFYLHILPILSKTSKIVVVNSSFVFNSQIDEISILDNFGYIKNFNQDEINHYFAKTLEIDYIKAEKVLSKVLSFPQITDFDFSDFFRKHEIINVRTQNRIYYEDLTQSEVN